MIPRNFQVCLRELVAIPYGFRGEGGGLDCWQLVHLAARVLFNRELPSFDDLERFEEVTDRMLRERLDWVKVERPEPCDVVLISLSALPLHCGLVVEPPRFLHTLQGRESCVERYDSIAWKHRIEGFYRWPM